MVICQPLYLVSHGEYLTLCGPVPAVQHRLALDCCHRIGDPLCRASLENGHSIFRQRRITGDEGNSIALGHPLLSRGVLDSNRPVHSMLLREVLPVVRTHSLRNDLTDALRGGRANLQWRSGSHLST